jgi:hypothetical protein
MFLQGSFNSQADADTHYGDLGVGEFSGYSALHPASQPYQIMSTRMANTGKSIHF